MEKFSEFNKNIKNNKFSETETEKNKAEIKEIQVEEKEFFGKVVESARYFFHFSSKENFKKAIRTITLAIALSIPVGEKAFAEREETHTKEPTFITAQIDEEINKLEQIENTEESKEIIEQRQLLKEKYGVEVVGDNSEYTLEELQDFYEALEKVQKFAPKQFGELKIVLLKLDSNFYSTRMNAFENHFSNIEEIKNIKDEVGQLYKKELIKIKQSIEENSLSKKSSIDLMISTAQSNYTLKILEGIITAGDHNDYSLSGNYDLILSSNKKRIMDSVMDDIEEPLETVSSYKNYYRDMYIHEISHLISYNNHNMYDMLSNKYDEINKNILSTEQEIIMDQKINISRKKGFVSLYSDRRGYISMPDFKKLHNVEDIAETITYMINNHYYADGDEFVREKIKAVEEFLNKKENE